MHRSGTSLTAALLGICGLEIGNNFRKGNEGNPKGYFEDLEFKRINKWLIKANGGTEGSFNPPAEIKDFPYARNARRLFVRKWATFKDCGWKDPRACLTLHLWKKELAPGIKVVICNRPAIEIAHSLKTRNGFPIEKGLAVTHHYERSLKAGLKTVPKTHSITVSYHDLISDWRNINPVCDFIGIEKPDSKIRKIEKFIDSRLWRERQSLRIK